MNVNEFRDSFRVNVKNTDNASGGAKVLDQGGKLLSVGRQTS